MAEVKPFKLGEPLTDNADGNLEPSLIKEGAETIHDKSKSSRKRTRICPCCKQEFIPSYNKQKYCSQECSHKDKGRKRPPVMELLEKASLHYVNDASENDLKNIKIINHDILYDLIEKGK